MLLGRIKIALGVLFLAGAGIACDPQHLKKCEWYLVPEMDHKHLVDKGWVPLCARNYTTGKQKCYLKSRLEFAEKVYGKPFALSSMKKDDNKRPHAVLSIENCTPEPKK